MWLKGNLHTHTHHADGDASPEQVVAWYAAHGYDFLAITEHNQLISAPHDALLLIPATELTLTAEDKPVHLNVFGIRAMPALPPRASLVATMQNAVNAARAVGGEPMINHPNYQWAFGAAELLQINDWALLEIFNASTNCNNFGCGGHVSHEAMWDELLSAGRRVFGVATDDAHDFNTERWGHVSPPGLAWVCVRASERTVAAVMVALQRGDFYSSTAVELDDISWRDNTLSLQIRQQHSYAYTTHFIGSGGHVLAEAHGLAPVYHTRGDEGYVRAKVYSSNGGWAWTQAVVGQSDSRIVGRSGSRSDQQPTDQLTKRPSDQATIPPSTTFMLK